MTDTAVNKSERTIARRVIRQTIKDLSGRDYANRTSAKRYVRSEVFVKDCHSAGYPPELLDALKEMVLLSAAERIYLSRRIISMMKTQWET